MTGKAGRKIGPTLRVRLEGGCQILDGQLTLTRDKPGLALTRELVSALSAIMSSTTSLPGDQPPTIDLNGFAPFADETAALSLAGISVENHPNRVDLWGQVALAKNGKPTEEGQALLALSTRILKAMEATELPDTSEGDNQADTTTVKNPFV